MTGRDGEKRPDPSKTEILHASCVAVDGRAVLIFGASGSGKSGLALQLMALGAGLVADDRTRVWRAGNTLMADAPDRLRGLIEAREVGILRVDAAGPQPVGLTISLDHTEPDRLPNPHDMSLLGLALPLLKKSDLPHFPAAIIAYLRGQREV